MRALKTTTERPAYTLLEVVLATACALLLMGALYVAMNMQLRHVQAGRDAVEQSLLARAMLNRISNDVSASLQMTVSGQISSSTGGGSSNSSGSSGSSGSSSSSSSSSSSTTSTSGSSSTATGGTVMGGSNSSVNGPVTFNYGIQGQPDQLVLYVSTLPRELDVLALNPSATVPVVSDLRRITYWLSSDGTGPSGLARQEIKLAISDDALNPPPPPIQDEASFIIAPEVQSLAFSYFDGTTWQDTWDGTATSSDGTPVGLPQAIAVTLGLAQPGKAKTVVNGSSDVQPQLKTYRHVIALPTANGFVSSSQP